MHEQNVRPKGLGLGASVASSQMNGKGDQSKKNGTVEQPNELELKNGAYVLVLKGSNKDKYGIVQGIDVEEARCIIKMAIGGKSEVVSQYSLQLVNKKDYDKNAKDISRLSKAYTEGKLEAIMNKGKHEEKSSNKRRNDDNDSNIKSRDHKKSRKRSKERDEKSHKSKKHKRTRESNDEVSSDSESTKKKKSSKHSKNKRSWVSDYNLETTTTAANCRPLR